MNVTEIRRADTERRYGHYFPRHTPGEVRVGTWNSKANQYEGFVYFDGTDAEERALDRADDLMREAGYAPEPIYPGYDHVEVMSLDNGWYQTPAMREHNKEMAA